MINMNIEQILSEHKLWLDTKEKAGRRADLRGANLAGADLTDVNFRGVKLERADLSDVNFRGVNLGRVDLSDVNLMSANLTGANLSDVNLTRANLERANLTEAKLLSTNLTGAELIGANLTGIIGKDIKTYLKGRYFAYSCDGLIRIGCMTYDKQTWMSEGREIGLRHRLSNEEIESYLRWIEEEC